VHVCRREEHIGEKRVFQIKVQRQSIGREATENPFVESHGQERAWESQRDEGFKQPGRGGCGRKGCVDVAGCFLSKLEKKNTPQKGGQRSIGASGGGEALRSKEKDVKSQGLDGRWAGALDRRREKIPETLSPFAASCYPGKPDILPDLVISQAFDTRLRKGQFPALRASRRRAGCSKGIMSIPKATPSPPNKGKQ
jgi:hypothetical protein